MAPGWSYFGRQIQHGPDIMAKRDRPVFLMILLRLCSVTLSHGPAQSHQFSPRSHASDHRARVAWRGAPRRAAATAAFQPVGRSPLAWHPLRHAAPRSTPAFGLGPPLIAIAHKTSARLASVSADAVASGEGEDGGNETAAHAMRPKMAAWREILSRIAAEHAEDTTPHGGDDDLFGGPPAAAAAPPEVRPPLPTASAALAATRATVDYFEQVHGGEPA